MRVDDAVRTDDDIALSLSLPVLAGDRLVGRLEPRFDRRERVLRVVGAWGDTSRADGPLASLARFLGARDVEWADGLAPSREV